MKSWQGRSCRKMVRHLTMELESALIGRAVDQHGNELPKGALPRPIQEINDEIATWRSRLAGPEPGAPPEVPPSERPSCRQCGNKLRPEFKLVSRTIETDDGCYTVDEPGELQGFGYMARGHFCSLRCGWRFAVDLIEGVQS